MNRNAEYQTLLLELEQTPTALENTVNRALARKSALQKKRRVFGIPAGSLAACFAVFVVMVNAFPTFAKACEGIPVLSALAEAVSWSPSLTAAVENEYAQTIGHSQTKNGVTASVEYVIVDMKKLTIFYTLTFDEETIGGDIYADYRYGDIEGWAGDAGSAVLKNGELTEIDIDFVNGDVPDTLDFTLCVYVIPDRDPYAAPEQALHDIYDSPESPHDDPDYLVEFTFPLEFDPYFTAQGEIIPVVAVFELDGQTFTLTEAELYPTHLRVTLDDGPDNTAWLKGLELYLENEHGERFESSTNGITASGDADGGEGLATFWLDSPFFSQGEELTLYITRVEWLDKDAPWVQVNVKDNTARNLPEGIRFLGAERYGATWWVSFAASRDADGPMYSLFSGGFQDEDGNEHDIMEWSSTIGYEDPETGERIEEETMFTDEFPLKGLEGDVAYLKPAFNRVTDFSAAPVSVPIK